MATFDGGAMVLLMLAGVTVVITTIRLMVRAHRIKEQAWFEQPIATVRRPADEGIPRREATRNDDFASTRGQIPVPEPARRMAADDVPLPHLRRA